MKEGWHDNDYLILFEDQEIQERGKAYGLDRRLPGHILFGLRNWDDFLIINEEDDRIYCVLTVPARMVERRLWDVDIGRLQREERLEGKIRWYLKPIVFGGDPNLRSNTVWVDHQTHAELVCYFNQLYDDNLKKKQSEQTDALNSHAFGTFGTSPAEQALVPKASGSK